MKDVKFIGESQTKLVRLQDVPQEDDPCGASPFELEWYMHGKYARLCSAPDSPTPGLLSAGRVVRIASVRTVNSPGSGGGQRLLPNEFCALLLDPSREEDAASLSETLVSDELSSVCPDDATGCGASYTLRFLVKKVGLATPTRVEAGHMVPRVRVWLRDPSHPKLVCFMLWGSQTSLAGLLQQGMDIILDRPLVKPDQAGFRLEFGPESLLYLVQTPRGASPSKPVTATPMGSHLGAL